MLPAAALSVPYTGHMKAWKGVAPSARGPTAAGTCWSGRAAALVG